MMSAAWVIAVGWNRISLLTITVINEPIAMRHPQPILSLHRPALHVSQRRTE